VTFIGMITATSAPSRAARCGVIMSDEPIEPVDYVGGVKVVDIGDIRVARGKTRREPSVCKHRNMVYDQNERRIWCADCEKTVDGFDAFIYLCERFDNATKKLNRREEAIAQAEKFVIRSKAAKAIDEHWRRRNMIPCCPHCSRGITPEDVVKGLASVSKEFDAKMRGKK